MIHTLYYVHDPMCSWCWGYQPTWEKLKAALPEGVSVEYVVGGLAPDSNQPMPAEMRQTISGIWRRIESTLGTTFNHGFWQDCEPRRSTYPACRAVLAAGGQAQGEAMIAAIQRAYYLQAQNPSDTQLLVQLAAELDLEPGQFEKDLHSQAVENALQQQIGLARSLPINGFPSLVLSVEGELPASVSLDYKDPSVSLVHIESLIKGVSE